MIYKQISTKCLFYKFGILNTGRDHKSTKMDINLSHQEVQSFKRKYPNCDISVCFNDVINDLNSVQRDGGCQHLLTSFINIFKRQGIVVKSLIKNNYDFKNKKNKHHFHISSISNQVPIEYILNQLFACYPSKRGCYIFDSQIDQHFFKKLRRLEKQFIDIVCDSCNIGNLFPIYMQHLQTQKLQYVAIANDPISNKGLKMLFSLDLQALKHIYIYNLNYTNDILNTLKKINSQRSLRSLRVESFPNFSKLFMNIKDLFSDYEQPIRSLVVKAQDKSFSTYLSKLKLKEGQSNTFRFYSLSSQKQTNRFYSPSTWRCLQQMITN